MAPVRPFVRVDYVNKHFGVGERRLLDLLYWDIERPDGWPVLISVLGIYPDGWSGIAHFHARSFLCRHFQAKLAAIYRLEVVQCNRAAGNEELGKSLVPMAMNTQAPATGQRMAVAVSLTLESNPNLRLCLEVLAGASIVGMRWREGDPEAVS